jgi:hypothetical protein
MGEETQTPIFSEPVVLLKLSAHKELVAEVCFRLPPQISELNLANRFGLEAEVSERVSEVSETSP